MALSKLVNLAPCARLVKLNSEVFKLKKVLNLKEKNESVLNYHLKSSKIRFKMGENIRM